MDLDLSQSSDELFPDVTDHAVDDPLDMGVHEEVATPKVSDKELNFKALRDEISSIRAEREYWKGQAEAMKSTERREPVAADPLTDIDWDDSHDMKKVFEVMRQENKRLRTEFQDSLAAMNSRMQHSDWNDVVSRNVPELTKKNPIFAEMIQGSSNPYEAAYLLSQMNEQRSSEQPQQNYAKRALDNARKPQTLASAGGRGTLSQTDYYAQMSDEDFMKVAAKNLANI